MIGGTALADEIDVVFGGALFCDLVFLGARIPGPGEEVNSSRFALTVGGVANNCVATARHGLSTGVVAVLGGDPLSDYVRSFLSAVPRLRLDWIETLPECQVPVTAVLTNEHDRSFITYKATAAGMPTSLATPLPRVRSCHVLLRDIQVGWVTELRRRGTTIYTGVGWDTSGNWSARALDALSSADVFVPNETEAMRYTGAASVEEAGRALAERVPLVVITRGERGVFAIDSASGRLIETPSVAVDVVDSTGAGDVFVSSMMAAALIGWPLRTQLQFASLCASLSVRTLGGAAGAPTPADILKFLHCHGPGGDWVDILDWARHSCKELPPPDNFENFVS